MAAPGVKVYSSLFPQRTTYSATYAAFPHFVQIAAAGTLEQRVAVLCLVGEMRVYGYCDEPIPADLLADCEAAISDVKKSSLKTFREAARAGIIGTTGAKWMIGDVLLAFGGLRYPQSGFVVQLSYLVREDWHVEADCPACAVVLCPYCEHRFELSQGLRAL